MTDQRPPETPEEHDEYHSALEVDDSSGWRVLVVPIVLILLVIGMIAAFIIYDDADIEPDPRVQAHLERKAKEAERKQQPVQPARVPAVQSDVMPPAEGEGAAPAEAEPTG